MESDRELVAAGARKAAANSSPPTVYNILDRFSVDFDARHGL